MPRITTEQKSVLDSFEIVRLSESEKNLYAIGNFQNFRNENLVLTLQGNAYEEDESGRIAYYLVKDSLGHVLFYFSLKCGQLYDHFIDDKHIKLIVDLMHYLNDLADDETTSEDDRKIIEKIREGFRSKKGILKSDLQSLKKRDKAVLDMENAIGPNLQRVGRTFAGIELVEFCRNDMHKEYIDSLSLGRKFGETIFWYFIVPVVVNVTKFIGCEYLFLFAADSTEDEVLINYYRSFLHFSDDQSHSAAIPLYDITCRFMYQKIENLLEQREAFLDNFNYDEEDV